jgi:hypothetical protein
MLLRTGRFTLAQRRRKLWTAGLRIPACTECPATAGEWCDPLHPTPAEQVRIDRDPPHVIHSTRIAAAVNGGHASRSLTIAQFAGGPLPSGLAPARR